MGPRVDGVLRLKKCFLNPHYLSGNHWKPVTQSIFWVLGRVIKHLHDAGITPHFNYIVCMGNVMHNGFTGGHVSPPVSIGNPT